MIAVMLADYREWKLKFSRHGLVVLVIGTGLVFLFTRLHFAYVFLVWSVFFIWLGWKSGAHRWNELKSWHAVSRRNIEPADWVVGKFFAFFAIASSYILLLVPLLLLLSFLWGLPVLTALSLLAIAVLGGSMTVILCLVNEWSTTLFGEFLSLGLAAAWIGSGFFMPFMAPVNPMLQILKLLESGDIKKSAVSIGSILAVQAAALFILCMFLKKAGGPKHE